MPVPHSVKKIYPILALSVFSSLLGVGIISPILPLYAETLGATGIWLGIIYSTFAVSRVIITPFSGKFSDRRGRKLVLTIGLFVYTVISIGYIWVNSLAALILVRFLHGLGSALVLPSAQAYVGDIAPEGEEGKWMGYFNAAFFTGFGCGPLMGGVLTEHLGMNSAFYAMGGLNMLAFLAVVIFLPETVRQGKAVIPYSSYREMAASNTVRGLFSFRLGVSSTRGVLLTFLPVFAGIHLGLSPSLIGILLTVQILGASLLQVPSGNIADRLNRRALVVLGCCVSLAATVLIPSASKFWHLLAFCLLLSLGDGSAMPAASAMTVDEGKKFGMGMTMAMFNMAFSIGQVVGPILAGVVADLSNTGYVFYFTAVLIAAGVGAFIWFTRRDSAMRFSNSL